MIIGNIHIKNKYLWITGVVIIVIILLLIINWIINSAFIDISVVNGKSGGYNYSFLNQSSNQSSEVKTNESNIKQLVDSGEYEVLAKQADTSFYAIVKANKFLSSTYLDANLKPENFRSFIGNNPGECMSYVNNVLVSFGCNELLANARVHIPATPSLPTYTITTRGQGPAGYNEGIFETKEGSFALSQIPQSSEFGQTQILYQLGNNFNNINGFRLTSLNPSTRYNSIPYKNGFIAYNQTFSELQYFPTSKDQSTNIAGVVPDSSNTPISLDVRDNTILTSYSKDNKTTLYLNTDNQVKTIGVDKHYSNINFCEKKYICMLNDKTLDIYLLDNNQVQYQYSVNNVESFVNLISGLYIANNYGVLKLDIQPRTGYLSYSYGEYKFNGIVPSTSNTSYVLNLTNQNNNKVALLINPNKENTNNIDKKILVLQKDPNIRSLSIYGNFITVVPNIPRSNQANGQFDPIKVKEINQKIQKLINESGINLDIYKFNSTIK